MLVLIQRSGVFLSLVIYQRQLGCSLNAESWASPHDLLSEHLGARGPGLCTVASSVEVTKASDFGNPGGSDLVHRLWAPAGTSHLLCGLGESATLSDPCFSIL